MTAVPYAAAPWSAETRDYDATWDILDRNGDHVASVPNPYEHLGDRDDLVAEFAAQTEAHAHLLATAPELLAALKEQMAISVRHMKREGFDQATIDDCTAQARAAIAKATGQ